MEGFAYPKIKKNSDIKLEFRDYDKLDISTEAF